MTEKTLEQLRRMAVDAGFSRAAALDIATLTPQAAVRDMCAADRCGLYGHCWTCPPACGSLEENAAHIRRYRAGLLVQTTQALDDAFDYEGMQACENKHARSFRALHAALRALYPDMLALGAGGCRLCEACTYPDTPCRRPQEATASMEAYGLLVSEVCERNSVGYYYGANTVTFTGCYLF